MQSTDVMKITSVKIEGNELIIRSEEQTFRFTIDEISKRLSKASDQERNNFQISPGGYGIHWPEIDEDLSLSGLLNTSK